MNTFAGYPCDVDFALYVAQDVKVDLLPTRKDGLKSKVSIKQFKPEIGKQLVHQYYETLKKDFENTEYDMFIYSEDDMEITPKTFETFVRLNRELDDDTIIGFMRYEVYEGKWYMNEFQPGTPHSIHPNPRQINRKWYVTYQNIHQGCYILERRNLKYLLDKPNFVAHWPQNTVMLEDAASNVFKGTWPGSPAGLERVHPVDDIKNLTIHHLSDRHTKISRNFLTIDQVEQEIQLCLTHSHPQ